MSEWAGMFPTGRRIAGPASDLVELDDGADGTKTTAIVFHERFREHDALKTGVELSKGFMEFPMVSGLVELSHWLPETSTFIYPTGTSWTATEVVRTLRDAGGITVPARAILEAMFLGGMILQEAAETGPQQGVFNHGSLGPNRVLFKADGQVQIIGHGLPSVDFLMWREDADLVPSEDSLRYAPPERYAGVLEDGDSDIYSLCLVLFELLSGEPVYDGSVDAIRKAATAGDADKRVTRAAPKLKKVPKDMVDLFVEALNPDPDNRPTPLDFVKRVEGLLGENPDGVTLADVMEKVRQNSKRGRSLATPAASENVRGRGTPSSKPEVRKGGLLAAGAGIHTFSAEANTAAKPIATTPAAAPEGGSRWGKAARRGAETAAEPEKIATPAVAAAADRLRDRLRQRAEEPAKAEAATTAAEDAREKLRNRLKKNVEGEAPAEPAKADTAKADDARDKLRERLKKSQGEPAAEAEKVEAKPKVEEPKEEAKDSRESLRDRLKNRGALPSETPAEPAKAAETEKSAEVAKDDPRAALRERLRQRQSGEEPAKADESAKDEGKTSGKDDKAHAKDEGKGHAKADHADKAHAKDHGKSDAKAEAEPAKEDPREALRRKLKERAKE